MFIFRKIFQALVSVHNKQLAHQDLKADNIIYDYEKKELKLIDFGFTCCAKEKLKSFCGTPAYMAPEIVNKVEYCGQKADVWAVGVLLFSAMTGKMPFDHTVSQEKLFKQISRG